MCVWRGVPPCKRKRLPPACSPRCKPGKRVSADDVLPTLFFPIPGFQPHFPSKQRPPGLQRVVLTVHSESLLPSTRLRPAEAPRHRVVWDLLSPRGISWILATQSLAAPNADWQNWMPKRSDEAGVAALAFPTDPPDRGTSCLLRRLKGVVRGAQIAVDEHIYTPNPVHATGIHRHCCPMSVAIAIRYAVELWWVAGFAERGALQVEVFGVERGVRLA